MNTIKRPILSIEQLAAMFKVSSERIKQQYAANSEVIKKQMNKAIKTGKIVDGKTAEQHHIDYEFYLKLSK